MLESLFVIFDRTAPITAKIRGYVRWLLVAIPAAVGYFALWKSAQYAIEPDAYGDRAWFEIAVSGAWIIANASFSVLIAFRWRRLERWEFLLENRMPEQPQVGRVPVDYFVHQGFDDAGNDLGSYRVESSEDFERLKSRLLSEAEGKTPPELVAFWKAVEKRYRGLPGDEAKQVKFLALNEARKARAQNEKYMLDSPSPIVNFSN